jgi:DNA polymerase III gamma/tau subunit
MKDVARHIAGILDQENITWDNQSLGTIVKQFYPDIRKILGTAQLSTIDNKIVLDKSILVSNNYIEQVINELKTSKNWKAIRQIIADSNINDYDELFKALYENASTYAEGNEGMITIIIEEYQYHSNFRIDKEINIMACIAKIIQIL